MPHRTYAVAAQPNADTLYQRHVRTILEQTDRLFAGLMVVQWIAAIAAAYWIAPRTWTGTFSQTHLHVWAALYLGGAITVFPVALALLRPGETLTRHVVAVAQMLMSSLLIHLTGGRIETHFHVFGSLAFLSFYRDWRVLIPATVVVAVDHYLRGVFWPQSVFGVLTASHWRWLEHAGWVVFEDVFLIGSCLRAHREMHSIAERTADLHASEARYRAILDRAEGVFLADARTLQIVEANAAFRNLLGLDSGAPLPSLQDVDAGSAEEIRATWERLASGSPMELERRYRRRDGTVLDVIVNLGALAHGASHMICGAVHDVTERRRAEEALRHSEAQLRQSQKMEAIGQLAGGIAHDFNNLLTGILGYGALALKQVEPGLRLHADIQQITRAGESAAALTQQLLTFSRRQVVHPQVVEVNAVLSGIERMLRRLIGEQIRVVLALDPALRAVEADPGQLEQVVMNLAVNARDAMPRGGELRFETSNVRIADAAAAEAGGLAGGDYVALTVADTGCGMTPEVQTRIFEPFFTTKEAGKGTGLGLSTVYGIVKACGGALDVSSAVGRGTTFRILLPAVERPVSRPRSIPSATPAAARASECVLLIEDDSVVRALAERTLQTCGYRVFEASSPAEALKISARQSVIDVIVSDVVLPDMSGPATVDRILAQHPSARVLFISGYTADALARHELDALDAEFLQKPFTPDMLLTAVRELLETRPARTPLTTVTTEG